MELRDKRVLISADGALSELSRNIADSEPLCVAEQLLMLSALAGTLRAEQDRARAMAREIEQLRHALKTRDIIGQAKGILMERWKVDAAAAFDLLARASQQSNTRLVVIAKKVVALAQPST